MSETSTLQGQESQAAGTSLILTVTQSGSVCSVIEAQSLIHEEFARNPSALAVDTLWNAGAAERIRAALRRTVKSRESCGLEMDHPDGLVQEFIFVPQGADRIMMIVRDLTAQKKAQSRAQQLAYTDDVTGLPNREFLFTELRKITEMQRLREGRSALICIHIGHFDDYGYALSACQQNEVLAQISERLTARLRGSNSPGASDYERYSVVTRNDFRQFCVVLPAIGSGEDAESVAERIVADLREPIHVTNRTLTANVCAGIALYPQDGTEAAALYENAIAATEDARGEPDAAIKFHSGTVRLRALQRSDLEAELKTALNNDDYDLYFLPIVDAATGEPCILEALLRWPDAVMGSQPTRKIVRVAERTGLISPIGRWVLSNACRQLQAWKAAGHHGVRLAVNLSSQELVSEGIADRIAAALEGAQVDPADIDIEIKEHMLLRDAQSGFVVSESLKALGLRLVVDDYGAGACSLAHLAHSPIDAIKVDSSLLANIETSERDVAACTAAVRIADALGIEAVAAGIETEQQADVLRELGFRLLQGFLLSTPMNGEETQSYLQAVADQRAENARARD